MPDNNHPPYFAFTLKSNQVEKEIISLIGITTPTNSTEKIIDGPPLKLKALWDTGATHSVITKDMAQKLGLIPINFVWVHHGGGNSLEPVFNVNIFLPNRLVIQDINVTGCPETAGRFDAIIGMDIISQGDFSFSNFKGKSTFSFRMPSFKETDFLTETINNHSPLVEKKLNRNDPCWCGSGKKYKKCHGDGE